MNKLEQLNELLYEACKEGNIDKLNELIQTKSKLRLDFNTGLYYICYCGHFDLIKYMFERTKAIEFRLNSNYGLEGACNGGHMDIINLMIEKGANRWDIAVESACYNGHLEIAKLMIRKAKANKIRINWNDILENTVYSENIEIIDLLLSKGAKLYTEQKMPQTYTDYKRAQALKYTKIHESLITTIRF